MGAPSLADNWLVKGVHASMAGPPLMYPIIFATLLLGSLDFESGLDYWQLELAFTYAIIAMVTAFW